MPKIENWSRTDDYRDYPTWRNDNTGTRVTVQPPESSTNGTNKYIVWKWKGNFRNREGIGKSSKNKERAMKMARKWMRNNPKG